MGNKEAYFMQYIRNKKVLPWHSWRVVSVIERVTAWWDIKQDADTVRVGCNCIHLINHASGQPQSSGFALRFLE